MIPIVCGAPCWKVNSALVFVGVPQMPDLNFNDIYAPREGTGNFDVYDSGLNWSANVPLPPQAQVQTIMEQRMRVPGPSLRLNQQGPPSMLLDINTSTNGMVLGLGVEVW